MSELTDRAKLDLIEEAAFDPSLSDFSVRVVVQNMTRPLPLTKKDMEWAQTIVAGIDKSPAKAGGEGNNG